jgi:hypothetical protein
VPTKNAAPELSLPKNISKTGYRGCAGKSVISLSAAGASGAGNRPLLKAAAHA